MDLRRTGYTERTGRPFYERMRLRAAAVPDVEAVSLAIGPPLGNGWGRDYVAAEGAILPPGDRGAETRYSVVDDRYFSTLGISVLAGRTFNADDRLDHPEVVVVNATMAQRHWAGQDPIGRRLRIEHGNRWAQVVGVVADGKYDEVDEPSRPFMYFALEQHYLADLVVIARTRGTQPTVDSIARALREIAPQIVFSGIGSMTFDHLLAMQLFVPQAIAVTISALGALTLSLAVVGLYSTVFYSVSQRQREMGIRVALGAGPRDVFMLVLSHTARVAFAGAALRVLAGSAALPLAAALFYGIRPVEPTIVLAVAGATVLLALATAFAAARPWIRMSAIEMVRR